jgi:hypothetical protein
MMHRAEAGGTAGHWFRNEHGQTVIGVRGSIATQPVELVATIAHEFGHELLLGEGRIAPDRFDHEQLTDVLTVLFGLGLFAANAAREYAADSRRWRSSYQGYLSEQMWGYALARYALLRGEPDPGWAGYLDTNPRAYLKQSIRYLTR